MGFGGVRREPEPAVRFGDDRRHAPFRNLGPRPAILFRPAGRVVELPVERSARLPAGAVAPREQRLATVVDGHGGVLAPPLGRAVRRERVFELVEPVDGAQEDLPRVLPRHGRAGRPGREAGRGDRTGVDPPVVDADVLERPAGVARGEQALAAPHVLAGAAVGDMDHARLLGQGAQAAAVARPLGRGAEGAGGLERPPVVLRDDHPDGALGVGGRAGVPEDVDAPLAVRGDRRPRLDAFSARERELPLEAGAGVVGPGVEEVGAAQLEPDDVQAPVRPEGHLPAVYRSDADRRLRLAVDVQRLRPLRLARGPPHVEQIAGPRLAPEVDDVDDAFVIDQRARQAASLGEAEEGDRVAQGRGPAAGSEKHDRGEAAEGGPGVAESGGGAVRRSVSAAARWNSSSAPRSDPPAGRGRTA